jgi:hypothetical protein
MLRGSVLYCLQQPAAAERELLAGLQLDAQATPLCRAEPSLVMDAHSTLALIHAAVAAGSVPASSAARASEAAVKQRST